MAIVSSAGRTWVWAWSCVVLATAACQHAGPSAAGAGPCGEALRRANRLAALLFEHDGAAARASDVLLERFGRDERVRGFVTVPGADGIRVVFYGDGGATALYTVWPPTGAVTRHEPPEPPDPAAAVRIRALRTAAALQLEFHCAERQNPVVLPAAPLGERGWLVYFLTSTERAGEIVVGGHVRRLVSEDGSALVRSEPLSNACLTLPPPPPGARFAWVTHVVTPCPVETHVLAALQTGRTLMVRASAGFFKIETRRKGEADEPVAGRDQEDPEDHDREFPPGPRPGVPSRIGRDPGTPTGSSQQDR